MNTSSTGLAFGTCWTLLLGLGPTHAQELGLPRRVTNPPKEAGVYHLATRTWTRNGDARLGRAHKVLYNNSAWSGFAGFTGAIEINWTDEGRIPSTGGHSNSRADSYRVDGFQVAYCDKGVVGPLNLAVEFYNQYISCTDPRSNNTRVFASGSLTVPGLVSGATESCWIVTFDLVGSGHEFAMSGDGDGVFDGSSTLDNFGWQLHLDDGYATTASFGPLLCYDPLGYFGCAAAEGDGTYYQSGTCTSPYGFGNFGSGLGLADMHYGWAAGFGNGCYWFGGYTSSTAVDGFWMVVYGDFDGPGTTYCTANTNSVGRGGQLSVEGSGSVSSADTLATASQIPDELGIFIHGSNPTANPFGCGWLCARGNLRRGECVVAAGNSVTYAYDESGAKHSLAGFESTTRYFQYWYRDRVHAGVCGNVFNLTDAVAVPIVP